MSTSVSNTTGQGAVESLDERDKLSGRIDFKCDKFVELANAGTFGQFGEKKLCIRGLTWRMKINNNSDNNFLGVYIYCEKESKDKGWSCPASVELCLHSQKEGGQNIVSNFDHDFHSGIGGWGFPDFIELEKIRNPANGWLDKDGGIHISAEIKVEEPQGLNYIRRPDVLLVNEEEVRINKFHLALKSDYFGRFFFGEDAKKNTKVDIDPPATVDDFRRMLDAMEPENRPLDDLCIEGVLKLANKFLLGEVEGKCRNFLADESKHSAVFKYRLADFYGFELLKKQILNSSTEEDFFKKADFVENVREYGRLDEEAREALDSHLVKLFGQGLAK